MSRHYMIGRKSFLLADSQVVDVLYNAATLVAKFKSTDDPASLIEHLMSEAKDMTEVFSSDYDLSRIVTYVAAQMGIEVKLENGDD